MKLWKHVDNKDVAFEILKSFYVKEKRMYKMQIEWWNLGPHEAFSMGVIQKIQMPVDVLMTDWVQIDSSYRVRASSEVSNAKSNSDKM
mgnify:CR=1 FL=1